MELPGMLEKTCWASIQFRSQNGCGIDDEDMNIPKLLSWCSLKNGEGRVDSLCL